MTTRDNRRAELAEVIRALMDGPKTTAELVTFVDCGARCVESWILDLRRAGVVRIGERLYGKQYVFALQAKPFELPDAPLRGRKASVLEHRAVRQQEASMSRGARVDA